MSHTFKYQLELEKEFVFIHYTVAKPWTTNCAENGVSEECLIWMQLCIHGK